LAFTIDDFCDAPTCAALHAGSEDARLRFATQVAGELFAGTWGRRDGLRQSRSSSSDANNDAASGYPEGLHVDTNNDSTRRSVTALLYLHDLAPGAGGGTAFPLAGAAIGDRRLAAARRLLGARIAHTRGGADAGQGGAGGLTPARAADAARLEGGRGGAAGTGLRVRPERGKLLLFFSRTGDGEIDPCSFHGGERLIEEEGGGSGETDAVPACIEKSILTLFKEVDYGTPYPDIYVSTFEHYLAPQIAQQRRALQSLAEAHAPFFQQ
jgi:hypothetical protein